MNHPWLSLISFCLSLTAFAGVPTMNSSVNSSTGGAGRGAIDPYGIVYMNHSILAQFKQRYFISSLAKDQLNVSLMDSGPGTLLSGALSYRQFNQLFENLGGPSKTMRQFTFSVADKAFGASTFGFNIHYFDYKGNNEQSDKRLRADLGVAYNFSENWTLGVVGQGYILQSQGDEARELDQFEPLQSKSAVGLGYVFQNFVRFRVDIESEANHNWSKPISILGIESFLSDWVIWRVGYQNKPKAETAYFSTGLGFTGPQFGLHYGYIQDTKNTKDNRHSIDFGVPF